MAESVKARVMRTTVIYNLKIISTRQLEYYVLDYVGWNLGGIQ